jgi:hypothetical protein
VRKKSKARHSGTWPAALLIVRTVKLESGRIGVGPCSA